MPTEKSLLTFRDATNGDLYTIVEQPDGSHLIDVTPGSSARGGGGGRRGPGAPVVADDDCVLSAAVAAMMLNLSRWTLMRMRLEPNCAGLPYVRLSANRIGYRLGDIRVWQRARRVGRLPNEPATDGKGSPKAA